MQGGGQLHPGRAAHSQRPTVGRLQAGAPVLSKADAPQLAPFKRIESYTALHKPLSLN